MNLTKQQIDQYCEEGYLLVSGIFDEAELDELEREFDGIVARRLAGKTEADATWAGDWQKQYDVPMQLIHAHDVQLYSAAWARALLSERLAEVFSALIGSPNVQLHHTKLFQKPPERGSAFPMHQDYPYFPHEKHTMMAGIIHLSEATEEMGCVCVYPGTHKLGPIATHERNHLDPEEYPVEGAVQCPARRGDVVLFNYLTVHGSGVNRSEKVRKTVLVQVRDPLDPPLEDIHLSHAQGMMLRGINPASGLIRAGGVLEGA